MGALLLTAFEPFGGEAINASLEAAAGLDGWSCAGSVVSVEALDCAYGVCIEQFMAAYARLSPRAVLMTGQASRRAMVCVERTAHNRASPTSRDNLGALGSPLPGGPDIFRATAPATRVAQAIRAAGIDARLSSDAGDYVCNHLYYGALMRLAETASPVPALFIHVPAAPGQRQGARGRPLASADAARALKAALKAML